MGDSQKPTANSRASKLPGVENYEPTTLIIGGGIAGLTCAEKLSKEKIPSILVEKEETLGGQLKRVSSFYHTEVKPWQLVEEKRDAVENNPYVTVYKKTTVDNVKGRAGDFISDIEGSFGKKAINVGSVVFATGNDFILHDSLNLEYPGRAITMMELEEKLDELRNTSKKLSIAMIVEEDDFVVGPGVALKNAYMLKKAGHDVYYFYDEIKVNEEYLEDLYRKCEREGIFFVRVASKTVDFRDDKFILNYTDSFSFSNVRDFTLKSDYVVFNEGFVPTRDTKSLADRLKVNRCKYTEFLQEDNYHLLPVKTSKLGVYAVGACRKPDFLWNIISEAEAAAEMIYRTLLTYKDWIEKRPFILGPQECVTCLTCLRICPWDAVYMDPKGGQCRIHRPACEGCGICVAECPNYAIKYPDGLNIREQIGPEGREQL